MRMAGIDVGSRVHVVAIVNEDGHVLSRPATFSEDAAGYDKLFELLGSPADLLVAMEATGIYGRNLHRALFERRYRVALLNPLRTRRFAEEDLKRAKTDSIDALGIARFAAQKKPDPTPVFDDATTQLREYVLLFDRLTQDHGDRLRQLHRLTHLCFPEFTRCVRSLSSQRATAILAAYPTARAFSDSCIRKLTALRPAGRAPVGRLLARALVDAAKSSVGRHHGPAYVTEMRFLCQDLDRLRNELRDLLAQLESAVADTQVGPLLKTINGLGTATVARIIAAVGDPARFRNAAAFAAYVGSVPGTFESGLRRGGSSSLCPLGNVRLRRALYMSTFAAVHHNPWLKHSYDRLRARGKPHKVALVAAMRKLLTAVYSVAQHRRPFEVRLDVNDANREPSTT
jgi:transposase